MTGLPSAAVLLLGCIVVVVVVVFVWVVLFCCCCCCCCCFLFVCLFVFGGELSGTFCLGLSKDRISLPVYSIIAWQSFFKHYLCGLTKLS